MKTAAVAVLAVLACTAQTPPPTTSDECPNTAFDTRKFLSAPAYSVKAPAGGALRLAAATDAAAEARGLMCVVSVPSGRGMIFAFADGDGPRNFWMKNTLVPLDMVFVTSSGRVSGVAAGVPATPNGTPDESVERRAGTGRYVIELGAGDAARHGIKTGVRLSIPALGARE